MLYIENGTKGDLNAILVLQSMCLIISEIDLAFYVDVLQFCIYIFAVIVMKVH